MKKNTFSRNSQPNLAKTAAIGALTLSLSAGGVIASSTYAEAAGQQSYNHAKILV